MRAYAVPAVLAHVHLLAPRMRPADRLEVLASHGWRPAQALRSSLRESSMARTVFIGGEAACIFGVRTIGDSVGIIWMLTSDTVDRHPIAFWKASKHVMRELSSCWPVLVQCIDGRHEQALRWVRRLGFVVDEPHPCGPLGMPFHQVSFTAKAGR